MDRHSYDRRQFIGTAAGGAAILYTGGCALLLPSADSRSMTGAPADPTSWPGLAEIALAGIKAGGCSYGDIRLVESRTETVRASDQRITGINEDFDSGLGIRALYNGAWGFAATSDFSEGAVQQTAKLAAEIARASHTLMKVPVKLADEPIHVDTVRTEFKIDPFKVSVEQKSHLLLQVCDSLHRSKGVIRSNARLWTQRDVKYFASTEGTKINYDLLAVGGGFGATARSEGDFQSRSFLVPYARKGYEHIEAYNMLEQAERIAQEAVEKAKAKQPTPGAYDLVLDPAHLALTIHESCGHPTELDRALGYEANYAGTSFLTPDKLGHFQYGSKHVNLVADNTRAGQMASTGYDDDGVSGQRWPIIEQGTFTGYSTSREVAGAIGETRSRGSCRADSWQSVPIVRIANVGLEPGDASPASLIAGIDNGIYIEGRGSFSIDQRRYNFQFGGDAFWEIKNGKRGAMLKNVVYRGITPEFWNSCDGVANRDHWREYGFITCGKGQPGQSGWMTHAASPARFRQIEVMDPKG